ncbi:MAG: glycosyltransferase, partial [Actinomycetota bacterium]
VTICSSSGWAHGATSSGAKIVYCHAPARWLYQQDRYLGNHGRSLGKLALGGLKGPLRAWDRRAAASATKYVVNSSATAAMVRDAYGIEAEIVPPPPAVDATGPVKPVEGLEPGFLLVVARLLPYKNVDVSVHAAKATGHRLVVIGDGPERRRLEALGEGVATFLGTVDDATLRWCYDNCAAHIAMSHEDYGLSPLEAAAFGRPTVALRGGGYLDTVVDGVTGLHVDQPTVDSLVSSLADPRLFDLNEEVIVEHSRVFGPKRFRATMAEIVASALS